MPRKKELIRKHFRVAIFGSARIKSPDPEYKQVFRLAKMIASVGIDIVTGGGPGLMDAASKGHHAGRKNNHVRSVGLTIKLSREQRQAYHLDIKKDFKSFSGRLDKFMELSDVVVVAPGGVGTILELMYTWQLIQVKHKRHIPIILLGKQWKGLVDWIKKYPLKKKLLSKDDVGNLAVVNTCGEAMDLIWKAYKDHNR